jgi:aryl-alcohol dehydrogenase-like predicted oxidoreductase
MREAERSLRRLGTDRIDVYLLHGFDEQTPLAEQYRALDDLVRQGKVRYVGICNYRAWQVVEALWTQANLRADRAIALQHPYSLLNRSLEDEHFPVAHTHGLGIMAYAPLATGLLSGAYRRGQSPPVGSLWQTNESRRAGLQEILAGPTGDVLEALAAIASSHGATVAQVALAWVMSRPEITCAISGADTEAQMADNLAAADLDLSPDDIATLERVSAGLDLRFDGGRFTGPPPPAGWRD